MEKVKSNTKGIKFVTEIHLKHQLLFQVIPQLTIWFQNFRKYFIIGRVITVRTLNASGGWERRNLFFEHGHE